ncbi:hypothetical protein AGMMS49982_20110 [Bacteroidia bacterium]|nr:hypothetical protein AGMMS49982_20110 [Bacteroidia bacterium]
MNSVKLKLVKAISFLLVVCFACSFAHGQETKKIPVIYSTDLYHPPADPDDHYDLATLFLMPEFDVKAFIFDVSNTSRKPEEFGRVALEQISAITGHPIPPYAVGLRQRLSSLDDQAKEQPSESQGGVELILKTLRESNEKVTLFLVGSCRDFAAAYNREPQLLRQKVSAVYVNAGNGPSGNQDECNVGLDRNAYLCLLKSDLPVYWCPCIARGGYEAQATGEDIAKNNDYTYHSQFTVSNQAECFKNLSDRLKNFVNYALTASTEDPMHYLERTPEEISTKKKYIWDTGPFIHAAGRKIYARQDGSYIACSPQEAKKLGISKKEVKVFAFDPVRLSEVSENSAKLLVLEGDLKVKKSSVKVFHYIHPDYNEIMVSAFSNILETHKPLPVSVIFDTDLGPDFDDVGALTILHAMADSGEARILATLSSNQYKLTGICIDVINHYYGRPDLPVGSPRTGMTQEDGHREKWTEALAAHFPHRLNATSDVPDAVQIYRRILAKEPDASVVVVTVGFLTNLTALLQSPPDQYSPLDGKQLVAKKVKHLVSMAGQFPTGREYNVHIDATASATVCEQWPTRIIFSGFEIGEKIFTGKRLIASDISNTPAKEAFTICLRQGYPNGRLSWDQTAVLVAVRGAGRYFNTVKGQIKIEANGANSWQDDPNGKHEYLTWKTSPEELTTVIEDLMMHEAKK